MIVKKTKQFLEDLTDIVSYIAQDKLDAAIAFEEHIHSQVDALADPKFPRRPGRVVGTLELVAHPNYVVVLMQDSSSVTVLTVLHAAKQYP